MRCRSVRSLAAAVAAVVALAAPAGAQAPEPYVDPPWAGACEVHEFGEGEAPAPGSLEDDPRCVRYSKEDITVDDGGALAFLAAEPERVLAAASACRYWQQDRWSVQVSDGTQPLVSWSGSYWWDRGSGQAAAILRDFQIAGQPAGAHQVAALIEPLSAEWAEALRSYSGGPDGGAGGWMSFGAGDPSCPADDVDEPADAPADRSADRRQDDGRGRGRPGSADAPPSDDVETAAVVATAATRAQPVAASLPATGGGALAGVALLTVAAALVLRAVLGDRSGPKDP
ncbi:MAG TPA: hypothetical protein VFU14_08320 [Acidimicrobiales bacterium]|nr:hypothetical protein [Acidimicrobiales bacterium]